MQKEFPVRKHPRLKGYDYNSNGAYLITMCVKDGHTMLGQVVGRDAPARPTSALISRIIGIIKRKTNKIYGFNMWQTSFYDEIIRNEQAYHNIWQYIDENPIRWAEDEFYKCC